MTQADPAVSVVVATRNRSVRLERLIAALDTQDLGEPFEAVVVDDASTDETAAALSTAAESRPWLRTLRLDSQAGPGGARNAGWREARGDVVAFTDDDCEPTPVWLSQVIQASGAHPDAVVQGITLPHPREVPARGPYSRTLDVRELGPWFPTCNVAYPRALLEQLDGFDPSLERGEDTDLAWRAREAGAPAILAPDAVVYHGVVELGPVGRLRLALAWAPIFRNFRRHPALREALFAGLFWKKSHAWLLLAAAALVVARRAPGLVTLTAPYLYDFRVRSTAENASARHLPYYVLNDALETWTAARSSIAAGTLVL